MDIDPSDILDGVLNERDARVLHVLEVEELTHFSFEGLKRRLGVHPETLSRILFRLEEQGIVEKEVEGYSLTSKAKELFIGEEPQDSEPRWQVLQTVLPPNVGVQQLVGDLSGKWFGELRWFGYSESEEGATIKWVTADGSVQVDAVIAFGVLSIEVKLLQDQDTALALRAVYQLIGYVAKLYARDDSVRRVSHFGDFSPDFSLA
jgi:DNA-binding transcriptional ArsR family regulator